MLGAWTIANAVPLFSDIVNITGSLLSTQFSLTLPAFIYLAIWWKGDSGFNSFSERCFIPACVAVLVLAAYLTVVGTYSSVDLMLQHARDGVSIPFGCNSP